MFIVNSILNYSITVGSGDSAVYTSTPSGNNIELEFPDDFVCDGSTEQGTYFKANWYGGGTIGLNDMTINACLP